MGPRRSGLLGAEAPGAVGDDTGGDPDQQAVLGRYRALADDRSRPDDRMRADPRAHQNDGVRADVHVLADDGRIPFDGQTVAR